MRAIRWIVAALLAVTAVLFTADGVWDRISGRQSGPRIQCPEEVLQISVRDPEEMLLTGVTAEDPQDGDLTGSVIVGGVSRLTGGDTAEVTYLVFDKDNNMASHVRQVRYTDYHRPVIQLTEPLVYPDKSDAKLLERVTVTDAADGDISHLARVSTLWATEDPDVFSATVTVTNSLGDIAAVEVPVFIRSTSGTIRLRQQILYLEQGAEFDPMAQVASGGAGLTVESDVDPMQPGCYWVRYTRGTDLAILTVVVE